MIINLSKKELEKCKTLLYVKEQNISAAEIYIEYLNNHYNDIKFAKDSDEFYHQFLKSLDTSSNNPEIKEINEITHLDKIDELNPKDYLKDDYFNIVKNVKAKDGDCQFLNLKYLPYEGFTYNELEIDKDTYTEHTPIGYFKEEFIYPAIIQKDLIWMSLIPHEIETMKQPIKNARGSVLVLGLGLGYYLYHVSNKKEVTKVDVLEIDSKIINLFNKYLIDKFPHKEKINIIKTDAIEYLKTCPNKYDYVFVDIYHNVGDGEEPYLKIKGLEHRLNKATFDYWIETSLLAMLRRQTLTVFEEALEGLKEEDYLKARNFNDEIINKIYFYHKNTIVDCYDVLQDLLTGSSLKKMANELFKS